jgi:hypothetical protein
MLNGGLPENKIFYEITASNGKAKNGQKYRILAFLCSVS